MTHGLLSQGFLEVGVETYLSCLLGCKRGGDVSFGQSLAPKKPKSNAIYLVSGLLSAGVVRVDSNSSPCR